MHQSIKKNIGLVSLVLICLTMLTVAVVTGQSDQADQESSVQAETIDNQQTVGQLATAQLSLDEKDKLAMNQAAMKEAVKEQPTAVKKKPVQEAANKQTAQSSQENQRVKLYKPVNKNRTTNTLCHCNSIHSLL